MPWEIQVHKIDKEGTMQQNGQEQAVRQPEQEGEPNTAAVSAEGEQQHPNNRRRKSAWNCSRERRQTS